MKTTRWTLVATKQGTTTEKPYRTHMAALAAMYRMMQQGWTCRVVGL